ncbi:hypothetical protein BDN72DRAFT_284575 [Pluteus cervinus]|uniref:Uncharacterized protein n=1 Tax=Pluteus cervinus TaxID=181527 RepID=A0ACD3B4Z2_9AGAR|nr:hypothetical protein BDN72DRAFT_284575 [Pluteus cervinus]
MPGSRIPIRSGRFSTKIQRQPKPLDSVPQEKGKASRRENLLFRLPDELLVEIVKEVMWRDALRLRRTCSRLRDITRSLRVWQSFARRESRQTLWLELPVESYNSEELEHLILRRKSADTRYEKSVESLILPQRTLPFRRDGQYDSLCLVPGGRWLLFSTRRGSVTYYDLNSEGFTRQELIPEKRTKSITSMCVDVDLDSPTLKFNLVLVTVEFSGPVDGHQALIEVWQVDLAVDERGKGVALTASDGPLASFLQEPRGHISSMSLVGDFFAYSISFRPRHNTYAFIVNWKAVLGTEYVKRVVSIPDWSACCLLDGYICVPTDRRLLLLPLESLTETIAMPSSYAQIPTPRPIATVTLPKSIDFFSFSYPVIQKDTTRFVIAADDTVYGIAMHKGQEDPILDATLLAHLKPDVLFVSTRISVSDTSCLVWLRGGEMVLQSFGQPRSGILNKPPQILPPLSPSGSYFYALDMASGQIVSYRSAREQSRLIISYLRFR